jgi:hypothetical protein
LPLSLLTRLAKKYAIELFSHTKIGKGVFQSLTIPRQHERDQQRAMAHQSMAAVVHSVLGFLIFVSNHNEVAMLCRHDGDRVI